MKMKFLQKLKTWGVFAFTALALSSMMACSDDKEDPAPPVTEPEAPTYYISGTVYSSDASTPLKGVAVALSGEKTDQAISNDKGGYKFELGSKAGSYTVKFTLEGYKTVTIPVTVTAVESGTIDYSVSAAMPEVPKDPENPEEPEKTYKTPTYSLKVTITDAEGKPLTAQNLKVSVKGAKLDITKNEASFTLPNLTPGAYAVVAEATGYDKAFGNIVINEVTEKVEGEGTFEVKSEASYAMKAITLTPEEAVYNIGATVTDVNGKAVVGTIKLSCSDESFTTQTWTDVSEFSVSKIDPKLAELGAIFYVSVKAQGYNTYSYTFKLQKVAAGQTWNQAISIVLNKDVIIVVPGEGGGGDDGGDDEGGDDIPTVTPGPPAQTTPDDLKPENNPAIEDQKKEEATVTVTNPDGSTTTKEIESVVTVVKPNATVSLGDISSTETSTSGTTTTVKDEISFTAPASGTSKIVIPTETATGETITDQTLSVKRDATAEKEVREQSITDLVTEEEEKELVKPEAVIEKPTAVVERVFEGGPSGTTFVGAPLTIKSPAPAGVPSNETLSMALLTSMDGKTWKEAPISMGSAKCENGQMIVEVKHFSWFAPGFVMGINKINSTGLKNERQSTRYSGKISKSGSVTLNTKVESGLIYVNSDGSALGNTAYTDAAMAAKVFASLSNSSETKLYLWKKLLSKVKADNNNLYPKGETFATTNSDLKVNVIQNTTIDFMTLTTTYIVKNYSIEVGGKTFSIGVKSVLNTQISTKYKSGHGHGHGDDMNAGGGIIDFE